MVDVFKRAAKTMLGDQRGVTAVEYALIAGALVVGLSYAFSSLTSKLSAYLGSLTF
jgi:Flp pilus assembly pilin Flp